MPGLCKTYCFFSFQCKCRNSWIFDKIFWLNHIYSLFESKIQILLLKLQISVTILLKSLILSRCKNKPISSSKIFLASERAFVLFHFAGVLVSIMLGLTSRMKKVGLYIQSNWHFLLIKNKPQISHKNHDKNT